MIEYHAKAPSGTGQAFLCGKVSTNPMKDALAEEMAPVTCPECLRSLNAGTGAAAVFAQVADDRQVGGDHYTSLGVQPWEAMTAWLSHEEFRGYLRGNAIKYLARMGSKGPELEDARKASHYVEKLMEHLEVAS